MDELITAVMEKPRGSWIERLRKGHIVYLPKEKCYGQIEWAYEPPEPGTIAGRIALRKLSEYFDAWYQENRWTIKEVQSWFIRPDGTGFDGSQLMLPTEGNLPEEALPIAEPWQRHIERSIGNILSRLEQLEARALYTPVDKFGPYTGDIDGWDT